jgi:hypothetical protein
MMKKEQSIRQKLQVDNCFNPFNKAFDVEVVREYITQLDEKNNDIYGKSIAEAAEIYNLYYRKYVQTVIQIVKKECICLEEIIETVFGMANYDYIELSGQAYKKGINGSLFDFAHLDIFNESMPASIQYNLVKRENNFNDDISYVLARIEVDLYYPYIYQEKIEMLNGLSVNDMIILFSQLSKLMKNIEMSLTAKINVRSEVPVKIKKRDIIRFLKQMTTYSKKTNRSIFENKYK